MAYFVYLLIACQGKHDQTGLLYDRAVAIRERALGPDHPDVAESLLYKAMVAEDQVRAVKKFPESLCGVR